MAFLDPNEMLQQQKNEENTKLTLITPVIMAKWQDVGELHTEEQQRIVDKLDQLLPLCDQLEKLTA